MAAKKKATKKSSTGSTPRSKSTAKKKVGKVMHEFKHHELKSGRSGKTVNNPKQAIAIGLSEARRAGADVPPASSKRGRKAAAKKGAPKKAAAKKSAAKKSGTKKSATKKRAATKKRG